MGHPTVLIADDHELILEGLRRVLDDCDLTIVGSANNGRALLHAAEQLRPDLVIADLSMPLMNGFEVARQLRQQKLPSKLILITWHDQLSYAQEAFSAGAAAYVLKKDGASELVTAIREVLSGNEYVSSSLAEAMRGAPGQPTEAALTERQTEILQLIAEGHSTKDIATKVNVSVRTVEFHKYRIMEALNVHNSVELTRYALRRGLVT